MFGFFTIFFAFFSLAVPRKDDCCYLYGSVPRSDINCVPEGGQLALSFIIYNPHDNFSNFTVTWFRSTTGDMSAYEAVPIDSNNNVFISRSPVTRALPNQNCSSVLYRDIFTLAISHFTRDRNGYYWCQISINNTYYAQRSRYAWFYAGEFDSTTCSSLTPFFRSAFLNETECIQYDPSTATLVASSTTTLMPTSSGNKSDYLLIYVLGGFSALLLVVLVGVVILSLSLALYVYHLKKKLNELHSGEFTSNHVHAENEQKVTIESEQEYDEICTNEGTMSEAECSAYQALNLDKMNCDSMYMKVMTSKK